jgi:hypothetical protein
MSMTRLVAATLAVLLLIPATAMAGPKEGTNGDRTRKEPRIQNCAEGVIEYDGLTELWPPNHKASLGVLDFTPADPEQEYSYDVYAYHNQVLENAAEMNGSGNTPLEEDITLTIREPQEGEEGVFEMETGRNHYTGMAVTGTRTFDTSIIAERSGQDQDGRIYLIAGTVDFGDETEESDEDGTCDFSFPVYVPHDQGNHNNEGRPLEDGGLLFMGL